MTFVALFPPIHDFCGALPANRAARPGRPPGPHPTPVAAQQRKILLQHHRDQLFNELLSRLPDTHKVRGTRAGMAAARTRMLIDAALENPFAPF